MMKMGKKLLMKKRIIGCITAVLVLGTVGIVCAEETEIAETEIAETDDNSSAESIVIRLDGQKPITMRNTAGLQIRGISVTLHEEDESLADILLDAQDGTQYEFLKVPYEDMQDPELIEEGAFAYIKYTGIASGKERKVGQTGQLVYSTSEELFAVDDAYIRSEPDSDAEILGVISRGDAIEVLGETASHYMVKKDDVTGYTVRKCISEDEQEAIAAVQAEEAARAQIRREAEAAAAAAQQGGSGSVTEISRQKFDDCDGSGHGYYLITYSDGSTAILDY